MSATTQEEMILGYQLRFWFVGVQPIVWRRLLFRADHTLADVHYAIQITCNWSDYFLHQFKIHGQSIGVPRASGPWYTKSAEEIRLSDLQLIVNERFLLVDRFLELPPLTETLWLKRMRFWNGMKGGVLWLANEILSGCGRLCVVEPDKLWLMP